MANNLKSFPNELALIKLRAILAYQILKKNLVFIISL